MEDSFQVIFTGAITSDQHMDTVKNNLSNLLKKDLSFVNQLFEKAPLIMVKNVDHLKAERWHKAFQRAGAVVMIKPTKVNSGERLISPPAQPSPKYEPSNETKLNEIKSQPEEFEQKSEETSSSYSDILNRYQNDLEVDQINFAPNIPQEWLLKAESRFGVTPEENILMMIDATIKQNMKNGLVLSDQKFYFRKIAVKPEAIHLKDIKKISLKKGFLTSILINKTDVCDVSLFSEKQQQILVKLLNNIVTRFKDKQKAESQKTGITIGEEGEKPEHETAMQKGTAATGSDVPLAQEEIQSEEEKDREGISFQALLKIFAAEFQGTYFQAAPNILDMYLNPFKEAAKIQEMDSDPLVLFKADKELITCRNGLLLTNDVLYGKDKRIIPRKQLLDSVQEISYEEDSCILYINGDSFFKLSKDRSGIFPHFIQLLMLRCGGDYNQIYMEKMLSRKNHWSLCPNCKSMNIKSRFNYKKAFSAKMIASAISGSEAAGLLLGSAIGDKAGEPNKKCNTCGFKWRALPLPDPLAES